MRKVGEEKCYSSNGDAGTNHVSHNCTVAGSSTAKNLRRLIREPILQRHQNEGLRKSAEGPRVPHRTIHHAVEDNAAPHQDMQGGANRY